MEDDENPNYNGDAIDEKATEKMATDKDESVRKAHAAGWKLDRDGWYIKTLNPVDLKRAADLIKARHMRSFVSDDNNAVMGEAEDCNLLDEHLAVPTEAVPKS